MSKLRVHPFIFTSAVFIAFSVVLGTLSLPMTAAANAVSRLGVRSSARGSVNVLYASSLQNIMERIIGPHFRRATGITFTGFSGSSGVLANEEKAEVIRGDVFISAAPAVNNQLMGLPNGNEVSWYIAFASSPLVIGYNPRSTFANALTHNPWYKTITRPGFRLGRTDPSVDPKGKLTVQAVLAAESIYNTSTIGSVIASASNIFPEQTLVGLLQSGQLDAGFFYRSEAKAAGIPIISLGSIHVGATYTATVLRSGANPNAGVSFVHYLLSSAGRNLLRLEGLSLVNLRLVGKKSAVPRQIRNELSGV